MRVRSKGKLVFLGILPVLLIASSVRANETVVSLGMPKGAQPFFRFTDNGRIGFMDQSGRTVLTTAMQSAGDFFEGRASFQEKGKFGFIDLDGNKVIPALFDAVRPFSEGFAAVRSGKKWGYIDATGSMVIPVAFQAAGPMQNGLARVASWDRFVCIGNPANISNEEAADYLFDLPEGGPGNRAGPIRSDSDSSTKLEQP